MMELYIETLTGAAFELRVSPFETIMSVKAKIQRLEGIPISQQHLIWQTVELDDDYCLHDYDIHSGATLKLVLAMRGGPINTRRVPMEDPTLREMAEYMESNREELLESLPGGSRQVTLLVFREGDQLNFFRVVEKGDGTLSPLSESLSAASMYNLYDEEEDSGDMPSKEKVEENAKIREKISMLKSKMDHMNISKKVKKTWTAKPPSPAPPSGRPRSSARLQAIQSGSTSFDSKNTSLNKNSCLPPVLPKPGEGGKACKPELASINEYSIPVPPPEPKPVSHSASQRLHHTTTVFREIGGSDSDGSGPSISTSARALRRAREFEKTNSESLIESIPENGAGSSTKADLRPYTSSKRKDPLSFDKLNKSLRSQANSQVEASTPQQRRASSRQRDVTLESIKESLGTQRIALESLSTTEAKMMSGLLQQASLERLGTSSLSNFSSPVRTRQSNTAYASRTEEDDDILNRTASGHIESRLSSGKLPPVKSRKNGKKSKRCFVCTKKTGLATSYQCRCGNNFCASHRYAETHACTFDYKTEGRKLLEQSNPVVNAPKLPKI